jgi:hypothetical protein
MTNSARLAIAMLVSLGTWVTSVSHAEDEAGVDAKTAFARIKKLEGEWKVSGADEHHGKDTKVIYKVTAAGSAVMETHFPGSGHEMVTMYHLDGKDLKVTHYCAAGNQPRLKLDLKGSKPDFYSFVFDGGTNLDPDKDMHIHGFKITFLEGGKVESEWDAFMDGKKAQSSKFSMSKP